MIIDLFPIHVYLGKVKEHKKIKSLCLNYIEKEYSKNPSTFVDAWDADVFTTFGKNIDFKWENVFPHLMPNIIQYAIDLNIKGNPRIESAWFNAYKHNQSQEIHDHLPNQFSGIYYISYDKEQHLPTIFLNPYRQGSVTFAPQFNLSEKNFDSTFNQLVGIPPTWVSQSFLKIEEGDIIIFPSFLEHKVPRQKSNILRSTLSFNLTFVS